MQSVTQEKSNRIVEVMISSVKPFELMMGKKSQRSDWPPHSIRNLAYSICHNSIFRPPPQLSIGAATDNIESLNQMQSYPFFGTSDMVYSFF